MLLFPALFDGFRALVVVVDEKPGDIPIRLTYFNLRALTNDFLEIHFFIRLSFVCIDSLYQL